MESRKVIVSGVGCCLVDRIYNGISFSSEPFSKYLSRQHGDGGLEPGKLEFEEKFEQFCGRRFPEVLQDITGGRPADTVNIGGPCIVALINAAQLTHEISEVRFYGCYGDDEVGSQLLERLQRVPVRLEHYRLEPGAETASTSVFSDPNYDEGHGERIFVNTIGASWKYQPDELDDSFYQSDIVVFGATALMPPVHEALDRLLPEAQREGALTVVNTVFDSLNEKKHPNGRWPLGSSDESYRHIDVLITDCEEALRLSGTSCIEDALRFFREKGTGAAVVTNGAKDVWFYADSQRFGKASATMPVSAKVKNELKAGKRGDTTGCGDNFAGGVIASLVEQLHEGKSVLDLMEAVRWGVASGGFTCFYVGGTYYEEAPGEKRRLLLPYYEAYLEQV
ncbi:MAG: carbohydrate kinase family protein [Bacteroidaceae bacterium]|nr:carbohydrate kinase family protein [Bacteroidaceae bacterium]